MSDADAVVDAVRTVLPRLAHWPKNGGGTGWNPWTEPHSDMCPPCALRAALGTPGMPPWDGVVGDRHDRWPEPPL